MLGDRAIFDEYRLPARSLGIYRVLYALCLLVLYLPQGLWIATFPDSFFNPPYGLTLFFPGFPPAWVFMALNVLAVMAAMFVLFGYRTRAASVVLALLIMSIDAWSFSFGKINNDIFLVLIPLTMAMAGWGDAISIDSRGKAEPESAPGWPVALLALLVGFGMMTAALGKATTGWLDPHSQAVPGHLLLNSYVTGRTTFVGTAAISIKSAAFWETADYATVFLEGAFLFAAVRLRAFRIVCALACFFHLGIALSMRIVFWGNVLTYAAFADWSWIPPFARRMTHESRRIPVRLIGAAAALALVYVTAGNPLRIMMSALPFDVDAALGYPVLIAGTIVAALYLGMELRSLRAVSVATGPHPVILFDGYCGLCNTWVDFVMRHDRRRVYRFAALQSEHGRELLGQHDLPRDLDYSIVLVDDRHAYRYSSAILRIFRGLGFPFSVCYVAMVLPASVRDGVYRFIAARRLKWFASRPTCRIPTPEERSQFIEDFAGLGA